MECRSFIQAVLSKVQEKSPLKYTFAQKLSCLNSSVKEWLLKAVKVTLPHLEPLFDI